MSQYGFKRPCIVCGKLATGSRCEEHLRQYRQQRPYSESPERKAKKRRLYNTAYQKQARWVRATAVICSICGEGARPNDPWEADHLAPGEVWSPLVPAHRSCNIAKGNKTNYGKQKGMLPDRPED